MEPFIVRYAKTRPLERPVLLKYDPESERSIVAGSSSYAVDLGDGFSRMTGSTLTEAPNDTTNDEPTDRR